jgi:trk system potassium uptake protein TrkA
MNILLVSESKITYYLAKSLLDRGYHIMLISNEPDICRSLSESFNISVVQGDAALVPVLEQAGIRTMDMVISLRNKDAENLVICELAKKNYHIKTVISFVNNPANISFFEGNGVDHCICNVDVLSSIISRENINSSICKYLPPGNPDIIVEEVMVHSKSKVLHKKLWEIPFPTQCLISCVLRNGEAIIPEGSTECMEDDKMIVIATTDAMKNARLLLTGQ